MRETTIPLSVVKEMFDQHREFTKGLMDQLYRVQDTQLKMLASHMKECAVLFEKALNPPITPQEETPDHISAMPRMSEEEEDWYFAFQAGDITKAELDAKLKTFMNGAYAE